MPRGGCTGGGGRRPGAARRCGRDWVARRLAARARRCRGRSAARGMVVTEITAQTPTEVSLVEDNHVVEDFAADGANHALDEGVLPRRARRGENLGDADPFHASPELVAVNAIA